MIAELDRGILTEDLRVEKFSSPHAGIRHFMPPSSATRVWH